MDTRTPRIPGPDHPITIEPTGDRVVVRALGLILADTTAALTLRETGYPPVHYVPMRDVDQTLLHPSATSTYCPYKGDATYFSVAAPGGLIEDAIWAYEQPYTAVAEIADHVAFYSDRVDITVQPDAEPATAQDVR
jgi:uncharacterized protein (DUF427 family)